MSGALQGTKTVDFPPRTGVGDSQVDDHHRAVDHVRVVDLEHHDQLEQHDDVDQPDQLQQHHDVQQPDVDRPHLGTESPPAPPSRSRAVEVAAGARRHRGATALPSSPAKRVRAEPTPTGTAN